MSAIDPAPDSQPVEDPDSSPKDLARQLRETRKQKGLSRAAVARSAGLTRRELRAYESGKVAIPESDLWCLAGSCGVPVEALLPGRATGSVSDLGALASGDLLRRLAAAPEPDQVLREYLAMVYELRNLAPGSRVPLGDEELRRLAGALGGTPEAIEHRLVELAGVTPAEAAGLRAMILPPLAISASHDAAPGAAQADPFVTAPDPFTAEPDRFTAEPGPFTADPDPFVMAGDPYAVLEAEAASYEPPVLASAAAGTMAAEAAGGRAFSGSSNGPWGLDPAVRDRTMLLIDELLADPALGEPDDGSTVTTDPFGFERTPLVPVEPAVENGSPIEALDEPAPAAEAPYEAVADMDLPVVDVGEDGRGFVEDRMDDAAVDGVRVGELPIVDLPVDSEDEEAWTADPWQPEPWAGDPWAAGMPLSEPIAVLDASVAVEPVEPVWDAAGDTGAGWWSDRPTDVASGPTLLDDLPLEAMLDGFLVDTGFGDAAPPETELVPMAVPVALGDFDVADQDQGWPERAADEENSVEPTAEPLVADEDEAQPLRISWSSTSEVPVPPAPEDVTAMPGGQAPSQAPSQAEPDPFAAYGPEWWRDAGPGWQLGGTFPNAAIAADGMLALRRAETRWALADADGATECVVDADVDLVSGAGFGIVFHADVDAQGRLGAYSFDVDPVRDGGTFLVRQWNENREHWRPLGEASMGPDVAATGRHQVSVEIRGDAITARFDGRRVLAVTGLGRFSIASGQEPCRGVRVGVHAWSTTELNVLAFRVCDTGAASDREARANVREAGANGREAGANGREAGTPPSSERAMEAGIPPSRERDEQAGATSDDRLAASESAA